MTETNGRKARQLIRLIYRLQDLGFQAGCATGYGIKTRRHDQSVRLGAVLALYCARFLTYRP